MKEFQTSDSLKHNSKQWAESLNKDKEWFNKNPKRKYRFRSMTPAEQHAFPGPDSIALHLLDSGDVMGMPLLFGRSSIEDIEDEPFARIVFHYAICLQEPGITPLDAFNKALLGDAKNEKP